VQTRSTLTMFHYYAGHFTHVGLVKWRGFSVRGPRERSFLAACLERLRGESAHLGEMDAESGTPYRCFLLSSVPTLDSSRGMIWGKTEFQPQCPGWIICPKPA